jgi:hypothetical protein
MEKFSNEMRRWIRRNAAIDPLGFTEANTSEAILAGDYLRANLDQSRINLRLKGASSGGIGARRKLYARRTTGNGTSGDLSWSSPPT